MMHDAKLDLVVCSTVRRLPDISPRQSVMIRHSVPPTTGGPMPQAVPENPSVVPRRSSPEGA